MRTEAGALEHRHPRVRNGRIHFSTRMRFGYGHRVRSFWGHALVFLILASSFRSWDPLHRGGCCCGRTPRSHLFRKPIDNSAGRALSGHWCVRGVMRLSPVCGPAQGFAKCDCRRGLGFADFCAIPRCHDLVTRHYFAVWGMITFMSFGGFVIIRRMRSQ